MKATKEFFDSIVDEIRSGTFCNGSDESTTKQVALSLDDVIMTLNSNRYNDLDEYLKSIDWFSVKGEDLIPREQIRRFAKGIKNTEVKLRTLKFLRKYEDYYFKDVIGAVEQEQHYDPMGNIYYEDIYGVLYSIADFHKELSTLIEQIESQGEFSTGKIDDLNAKIVNLTTQNAELSKKLTVANDLVEKLSNTPKRNANETPGLDAICEYAKTLSREEVKTIQNMLFSLMDISDQDIKKKITSMRPMASVQIAHVEKFAMNDNVDNKIVKQ